MVCATVEAVVVLRRLRVRMWGAVTRETGLRGGCCYAVVPVARWAGGGVVMKGERGRLEMRGGTSEKGFVRVLFGFFFSFYFSLNSQTLTHHKR